MNLDETKILNMGFASVPHEHETLTFAWNQIILHFPVNILLLWKYTFKTSKMIVSHNDNGASHVILTANNPLNDY